MADRHNPNFPAGLDSPPFHDRRNVIDRFKYWETEAIRAALDENRHEFALLAENFAYDVNISQLVRNANAFLAGEIWIVGRRQWDRRATQGTYHYEHIHKAPSSLEVIDDFRDRGYRIVAADNLPGSVDLRGYDWDPRSLMIFGQESIGVSQAALDAADDLVYIPQFGSTRSLNVGCASGIVMYDYVTKLRSVIPPENGLPVSVPTPTPADPAAAHG
jgi:tRNA G18 (ribose-2'-O)-methylase SpoU